MYRIVVLVLCYQALSQPVTDELSSRAARQLTECCPCPGSSDARQDMLAGGQLDRASGLDDCPCRPRDADSEGASSVFFPSTLRADPPDMRTLDAKENSKNLLEPEVALATSMLDTLREATEEEYQDALARDAAKSAAEDSVSEESARNVVIIVNPRDPEYTNDMDSEASHVQESRCVHPLGSTNIGRMVSTSKPMNLLPETLRLSKFKEPGAFNRNLLHMDSNLGASNVEESVIDINGNRPRFLSRSPIFNNPTPLRTILDKIQEANQNKKTGLSIGKINESGSETLNGPKFSLIPKFKTNKKVFDGEDFSTIFNNVNGASKVSGDKIGQLFRHAELPLNVRNLLKLRDVELIPKSLRSKAVSKPNLDIPNFTIPTLLNKSKNDNSFKNNCDEEYEIESGSKNVQNEPSVTTPLDQKNEGPSFKIDKIIPHDNDFIEETQNDVDTLPSPSQIQPSILKADDDFKKEDIVSLEDLSGNVNYCDTKNQQDLSLAEAKSSNSDLDIVETTTVSAEEIVTESNDNSVKVDDALLDGYVTTHSDSENSSSNNIPTFVPLDAQESQAAHLLPQNQNDIDIKTEPCDQAEIDASQEANNIIETIVAPKALNDRKIIPNPKSSTPLRDILSSFRKNVYEKTKNLKQLPVKTVISQSSKLSQNMENRSILDGEVEGNIDDSSRNQHSDNVNSKELKAKRNDEDTTSSEVNNTTNDVSMNDLQKMSDKLLNFNSKSQNDKKLMTAAESNIMSEDNHFKSSKSDNMITDNTLTKTKSGPVIESAQTNIGNSHTNKGEKIKCPIILKKSVTLNSEEKSFKSVNNEQKEMDTGASDTVINTLPSIFDSMNSNLKLRTPLLEYINVQPTSDPMNLLRKPLGNVLNLNSNLPTLDELTERVANIFNKKDGSVEEDSSSFEGDDGTYDSSLDAMASEASITDSRRKLPSIEDLNMEIFRNKPLTPTLTDRLSAPRLNLNSYRSKIPVPNNLEIKPVKLESSRPTLSIGSNRKTPTRKSMPSSSIVNNPLHSLPTIEDMRKTIQSRSKNILGDSKFPESDLFTKSFRSNDIEDIAETIRMNSEKTIKGLQRKMQSSLKKTKTNSPLGDAIAKPHELLDDMNDKLKAIHYDLNDRLSLIHENILDSSGINSLKDQFRTPENRNVMTNLRQSKARPAPARLRTAASTTTAYKVDPNSQQWGSDPEKHSKMFWNKLHDKQLRGSATPASDELSMPSLTHFENAHPLKLKPTKTLFLSEKTSRPDLGRETPGFDIKNKPIFQSPFHPFNQNKVTISFGTTTSRPDSPSRPVLSSRVPVTALPQTERHSSSLGMNSRPSTEKKPLSFNYQMKTFADPKFSPTQTFRNTAPINLSDVEFDNDKNDFSEEQNPMYSNLRSSTLRQMPSSKALMKHGFNRPKSVNFDESLEQSEFEASQFNVNPPKAKASENSFMSKVRGAINMRRPEIAFEPLDDDNTEMLRSPSENTNVVIEEPLKENVSYRCRMVCTKA